jgi:hypothetical protein
MSAEDDEHEDFFEETVYFEGHCTCDHELSEHGWGSCGDGCNCIAGWTE